MTITLIINDRFEKRIDSRLFSMNEGKERASPVEFHVLLVTRPSLPYLVPQTLPLDSPFILSRTIPGIPERHRHVSLFLAACWRMQPASCTSLDRLRFLPVHTDRSNTWRASKGTCVRTKGKYVHVRCMQII